MLSISLRVFIAAGFAVSAFTASALAAENVVTFDDHAVDKAPRGMKCVLAGKGKPGVWKVMANGDAGAGNKMLGQLGNHNRGGRYPVCVVDNFSAADVDLSVKFKPISGDTDQAGGLVWRYQDKGNFYVVRANALEDNVVLYKMKGNRRSSISPVGTSDYGKGAPVPGKKWSTLRVKVAGDTFTVFLNGRKLYDVKDRTFRKAGKVGIWTKADSVTYFDDLKVVTN